MISRLIKKQHGLTVVELMIVLGLMGIVLAIGYMYLSYGLQAFNRGEQRTIAQQAARLTSDFITTELRFAKQIEINPAVINEIDFCYIYLENDSIIFRDENGSERILADSQTDGMPYSIEFDCNVPDDVVIFIIEADNGFYTLDTRVQALNLELYREYNLELYGEMIKVYEDGDYTIIKYKKPASD